MEPISTALAGIALFKSAVDGIKGAISTANDVGEIAGYLDNLFEGEKQVQQRRNQKSGIGSVGDQFGIKTVAQEIIDAKLAQEQMQEIASMVDMRFGHGTWRSIVDERAKRIREAKEAEAAARKAALQKQKEFEESLKQALMIGGSIIVALALFIFLFVTIAQATALTLSIL
tara:strand:- start:251 stop:766 length:516 start_codon:yes stop_codon:yes gene_type:complete